ncbi:MAG: DUF5107 domain-containing protein [Bifidobacteriaceae bacterium]|jgi:tetratricopeptide (TPR) repeat protein|nr:DUF5107 domain-containing protein [Bifidobacteriaceae bacterium]
MAVTINDTILTIPTYEIGAADKNPEFIEKRVYQGSTGKVYPYPVVETISDEKVDKDYKAVIIENEYLKVTVLPELGGRIQYALDKTNNYDFVYHNDVIKPALVGLLGPWISGGIEFNWPQHHRPTTYLPVDYEVKDLPDGGKAVLCHDTDQIHGTEVIVSIGLHPGKAYIEISARLYNGTSLPQSFLWWANPAVPVNDHTQSIFPPDVTAVMDHGKRDVSRFPIATGTYYKHDYSEGVDISRYKNIPVPTSYMAAKSNFDFVGGYDYKERAGILHVADHHVSPGKKQWTWGSGDFGHAWDRNLTDANGPYVELMTGVFTDNQPDFTWLKPFEEKTFTQYFMPYKNVGQVKNATTEASLGLEFSGTSADASTPAQASPSTSANTPRSATATLYVTAPHAQVRLLATTADGRVLLDKNVAISPEDTVTESFEIGDCAESDITLTATDGATELVSYTPAKPSIAEIPDPAQAAADPEDIATTEELYLTGLHLEQYRHATYLPDPYYLEGLKRDPGDARLNNAYGRLLLRRGNFSGSLTYFNAAIKRLTWKNPNPYDCEAYFNLGVAQYYLNDLDAAYDAFYKATWDDAQQEMAFFYLALIAAKRHEWQKALDFVERGLTKNTSNIRAHGLHTFLLRMLNRTDEARTKAAATLKHFPFDFVSRLEQMRLSDESDKATAALQETCAHLMRDFEGNYLATARSYAAFGAYAEAVDVLDRFIANRSTPLALYYKAYYLSKLDRTDDAATALALAEQAPSDYCFPNKLEDIAVLDFAISQNSGAKAPYYLGCLYYDKLQTEKAVALWEQSVQLDDTFPTAHRNLALAYYNKLNDRESASTHMERAYALDESDARVLLELDQLHRKLGWSFEQRLEVFEAHPDVVAQRDDLFIEYLTALNMTGAYAKAYELMGTRHFHPWEGGEGKITSQYRIALTLLAKDDMAAKDWRAAQSHLTAAMTYPHNLGEGKLEGQKDNDLHYYLGLVLRELGETEESREEFRKATIGPDEVKGALYYNDQPAEMILFQGLAHLALGETGPANARFYRLLDYGERHVEDHISYDYFAVSLPDFLIFENDYTLMNKIHCLYLMGIANIGLAKHAESAGDLAAGDEKRTAATRWLAKALKLDASHLQANLFADEVAHRHIL